jgi:hypothetical protein
VSCGGANNKQKRLTRRRIERATARPTAFDDRQEISLSDAINPSPISPRPWTSARHLFSRLPPDMKNQFDKIVFRTYIYIFGILLLLFWSDVANQLNVRLYYSTLSGDEVTRDGPIFHPPSQVVLPLVVLLVAEIRKLRRFVA